MPDEPVFDLDKWPEEPSPTTQPSELTSDIGFPEEMSVPRTLQPEAVPHDLSFVPEALEILRNTVERAVTSLCTIEPPSCEKEKIELKYELLELLKKIVWFLQERAKEPSLARVSSTQQQKDALIALFQERIFDPQRQQEIIGVVRPILQVIFSNLRFKELLFPAYTGKLQDLVDFKCFCLALTLECYNLRDTVRKNLEERARKFAGMSEKF